MKHAVRFWEILAGGKFKYKGKIWTKVGYSTCYSEDESDDLTYFDAETKVTEF